MRIHQIHKLPTPYTDFFFRTMHASGGCDFRVYHLWRGSWRRPWKSPLAQGYHNTFLRPFLWLDWPLLKSAWREVDSFFIVGDWAHVPTVAVILMRCWHHAPVAIWTDTPQEDVPRPALKKWLRRTFLRWLLPQADIVFGTGKKALRLLRHLGARPEQLVNLPVFVDLERPRQASQDSGIQAEAQRLRELVGCAPAGLVFSMLGTLVPRKGFDIGLQAFARCLRDADRPLGLLIAGEGPSRPHLETLARQLNLGDSVAFLGWQEPEGVEAVYLASDIVVHPARSDPFPGVILEAMSWSKAAIGSEVCGNVEDRIVPGVNGFSFPSEDVGALSAIMLHLVNHPEELAEVGRQARKTAAAWPAARGVQIVLDTARQVLAAKSQRRT